jgi:hypothetical protein
VRASDAEREDAVAALQRALGEGRLELDETDVRLTAAYSARYRHELVSLLDDLPDTGGTGRSSTSARRPAAVLAALALGLGLLSGIATGALGVLAVQTGQHDSVGERHGPAPEQPWAHRLDPRDGGAGPASFWLPPRET